MMFHLRLSILCYTLDILIFISYILDSWFVYIHKSH
nr:hypothetical protein TDPV-062 [Oriental turtle dovepox virus]